MDRPRRKRCCPLFGREEPAHNHHPHYEENKIAPAPAPSGPESKDEPKIPLYIESKYTTKDVKVMDDTPQTYVDQKVFKYECPICMRYFDKILEGVCCK
ncbi:unnamed protein product [Moneuplotes crassus]|uniref:Uncharacterized protein n=1 Tax=Euplotes crassus TaxID=5936 RepID=A0AAD1XXL3_EUPCR|nr:unnamed protein product [Moneuplotes crassus]